MEDEPALCGLFERFLSRSGFDAHCAADGRAALGSMDAAPGFEAAIVDLTLPDMPGEEVGEQMSLRDPAMPVLFISGRPVRVTGRNRAFLQKPFAPWELVEALRRLLGLTA